MQLFTAIWMVYLYNKFKQLIAEHIINLNKIMVEQRW